MMTIKEQKIKTIDQETVNSIRNILILNPSLVFSFLDMTKNFNNYDGCVDIFFAKQKKFYKTYLPEFNPINVILDTNNADIISKYLRCSDDFTLTEQSAIASSFIKMLENNVEKSEYQKVHPEEYKFLKRLQGMTCEEFRDAYDMLDEKGKKAFDKKLLDITFFASKEDVIRIANDKVLYKMCIDCIYKAFEGGAVPYDDFMNAMRKSKNDLIVTHLAQNYPYVDEGFLYGTLYSAHVINLLPQWLCAQAYYYCDLEKTKDTIDYYLGHLRQLFDEYVEKHHIDRIYGYIDEIHTYDPEDVYTSALVKQYILKPGQTFKDEEKKD